MCFCPFRPGLRSSHLPNHFRFHCQPYFGHIFVLESPLMLLPHRERGEVFLPTETNGNNLLDIPGDSVSSPSLQESLISVGVLKETGPTSFFLF